jgi:hypothetical protein
MGNKRQANQKKREKVKLNTEKRKLQKQIEHLIKIKKTSEAGMLMQRYKSKYGEIDK